MHPRIGCMASQVEKTGKQRSICPNPGVEANENSCTLELAGVNGSGLSCLLSCDVVVGAATGRLIGYAWLNARRVGPAEQPKFSHAFQPRRFSLLFNIFNGRFHPQLSTKLALGV